MERFKSGFCTNSKKERKPESTLKQSSFTQPQPFSQYSGTQAQQEQKQSKKVIHAIVPTSQEKPKKQIKSALYQEVSELNPSGQMNNKQLIKVVLNLQEETKKLKKEMRNQYISLTQQKQQNKDLYPWKESLVPLEHNTRSEQVLKLALETG